MNRIDNDEAPPAAERQTVLVVDDQPDHLEAMEALLRRDDVAIHLAQSSGEALALLRSRPVAVALVAVEMAESDGYELAGLMRADERTRHVPLVFIAGGWSDPKRIAAAYEAGAVDFLVRPIAPQVLRSKVAVFVDLANERQHLRRSEQSFRTLVETTNQAVWRTSPDGRHALEDSPSWRALTGMSVEEWLAQGGLMAVHPDDRERVSAGWREAVATRQPWEAEYRVHRPDGRYTWTVARAAPVLDERGELREWIGANADIHPRKEAEEFRERFVGILGHDLRNPLNAIMVSAQLALLRARDEPTRTPIERVIASGERMGRLIEQVLDLALARLGGGIKIDPVAADLRSIVEQAIEEITIGKQRLKFEPSGDLHGTWDVDRMLQVVINLVGNAVAHGTPATPITIRARGDERDFVELSVHNEGPVVPMSLRDAVFEPGRRSDPAKRTPARGLGLGLYITRELVLAHGGTIAFESSEVGGNVLRVRLPRRARGRS